MQNYSHQGILFYCILSYFFKREMYPLIISLSTFACGKQNVLVESPRYSGYFGIICSLFCNLFAILLPYKN